MSSLEERLLDAAGKGEKFDIETALLVASGIRDEAEISGYKEKIAEIDGMFKAYCRVKSLNADTPIKKAIALHRFFFETKPGRARPADSNRRENIAEAIDAELSIRNEPVGSCVALTSLYVMLGLRNGLDVYVLANPGHVLSRVKCGNKTYDIENTRSGGIGKQDENSYAVRPPEAIVASVYANNASILLNEKEYDRAIEECSKAIAFDRKDPAIYLNRGSAKMKKGELKSALLDFTVALEISPGYKLAARALKIVEKMMDEKPAHGKASCGIGQNEASGQGTASYGIEPERQANDTRIAFVFGEPDKAKREDGRASYIPTR